VKNITGVQATETFTYDELQRLKTANRSWGTTPPPTYPQGYTEAVSYAYDDLGNITAKSDYAASCTYGSSARTPPALAGPHAVVSAGAATFAYDLNGNMLTGDGRTVDFDLMDRAIRATQSATSTDFSYAPDGARYRQKVWANPGPVDSKYGPKTVYYVDKEYELVVWDYVRGDGVQTEERTYVGGSVVLYRANGGARQERYLHLDRLGSLDAVTDGTGALLKADLHGYDAFGKPRTQYWTPTSDTPLHDRLHPDGDAGATSNRGFTGHEHLDAHYLIHMNGRVYDYRLGRFLSVDPIISNPLSSESINPYSYIGNNPLSGVDPTGYAGEAPGGQDCPGCTVRDNLTAREKMFLNEMSYSSSFASGTVSFSVVSSGADGATATAHPASTPDVKSPGNIGREGFLDTATRMAKGALLGAGKLAMEIGGRVSTAFGDSEFKYQSAMERWDARMEGSPAEAVDAGYKGLAFGLSLLAAKGVGDVVPAAQVPSGIELLYAGSKKAPLPVLPEFTQGGRTVGVLRTGDGDLPLQSGWAGPASAMPKGTPGFDIVTRTHVEGHAAAAMRQSGATEGTLFINNPTVCSSCSSLLPRMLPTGSRLTVVTPSGSTPFLGGAP
jgi:RHS repeat-associated protein